MELRRQQSLNDITGGIAWLATLCKLRGLIHLLDANVIAHEFFCNFLNEVFDLKLAVLDRVSANFPALDLGDEANSVTIQLRPQN
jgi:hypothetical protein